MSFSVRVCVYEREIAAYSWREQERERVTKREKLSEELIKKKEEGSMGWMEGEREGGREGGRDGGREVDGVGGRVGV